MVNNPVQVLATMFSNVNSICSNMKTVSVFCACWHPQVVCPWGRPCWSCSSSSVPRLWPPSKGTRAPPRQQSSRILAATTVTSPLWIPNSSQSAATSHPGCSSALSPQMKSQLGHRVPVAGAAGEQGSLSTVGCTQFVRASVSGWATKPRPQTSQATRWQCCQMWISTMSTRSNTSLRRRVTVLNQVAQAVWESIPDTGTPTAPTHTLLYERWLRLRTWWRGGSYVSMWPVCACSAASLGGSEDLACTPQLLKGS